MEDLRKEVTQNGKDIVAVSESVKSAHRRIDENDRITEGIHELASNVGTLALQVKMLTESLNASISRLEGSLKDQGERIGMLEKKPAKRWEGLVTQLISLSVAAIFGIIIAGYVG